jgi:hypothetical protein
MQEPEKRNKRKKYNTNIPSLSSSSHLQKVNEEKSLEEIRDVVFSSINNVELQKSLDTWLKRNLNNDKIILRDLNILKTLISEYLDAFITFGYNLQGERVIIQQFKNPKDRDAIMEFFKTVFIKQQHDNFLDLEGEEDV